MKRPVLLAVLAVLVGPADSYAQMGKGAILLTGNANYATANIRTEEPLSTDDTFKGWGLNLTVEKLLAERFSLGFNFAMISVDGRAANGVRANYSGTPFSLTGRYLFGSPKVVGYIGAGVGVLPGSLETYGTVYSQRKTSDFMVSLPLGAFIHLGGNTFANVNWTPSYVPDGEVAEDFVSMINLGLTFRFQ